MPNLPDDSYLFREEDIRHILRRAAELQGHGQPIPEVGLTLPELKQLALDAGIDPGFITTAAAELLDEKTPTNFWGGPIAFSMDRILDVPVDDSLWEEMVSCVRKHMKVAGTIRETPHTREWVQGGRPDDTQLLFSATPHKNATRLHLFWTEPTLSVATYIPFLVLGLILIPIIFDTFGLVSLLGAGLYFGLLGLLFLIARWGLIYLIRKRKKGFKKLMAQIEALALKHQATQAAASMETQAEPPVPERSTPPLLDIDKTADLEKQQPAPMRSREQS